MSHIERLCRLFLHDTEYWSMLLERTLLQCEDLWTSDGRVCLLDGWLSTVNKTCGGLEEPLKIAVTRMSTSRNLSLLKIASYFFIAWSPFLPAHIWLFSTRFIKARGWNIHRIGFQVIQSVHHWQLVLNSTYWFLCCFDWKLIIPSPPRLTVRVTGRARTTRAAGDHICTDSWFLN